MMTKTLRTLCLLSCLFTVPAMGIVAQGPPPGNPGSGPGGPGHPTGPPGGPGGPGNNANSNAAHGTRQGQASTSAPQRNALQFGPVGRWWDDKSVVQQIGLSKSQQTRMDSIFNASKPAILASYKAFQKAQSKLDAVNKNPTAEKATVFAAIDAVNAARGDLQKATSAMLLQIRDEMSTDQITKLEKIQ
jgi:hypothetical protein